MRNRRKFVQIFVLLAISVLLAAMPVLANNNSDQIADEDTQDQIDALITEYERALDNELLYGETETIDDPVEGEVVMLVGESAIKMESLWNTTISQINDLLSRPETERGKAVDVIKSIDGTDPIYLERIKSPYSKAADLERYQTERYEYTIDIATNQVIERFLLDDRDYSTESVFSPSELELKARVIIDEISGVDLDKLTPDFSNKLEQNYFFRWEDTSKTLDGDLHPFIQVGLTTAGSFLNYVNTLPFAMEETEVLYQGLGGSNLASIVLTLPQLGPLHGSDNVEVMSYFNEVYANGGGHWVKVYGSMSTKSNAGYCYIAGWCSPKNFYYANTCFGCSTVKGRWTANSNPTVTPYAFIPSTHATTLMACYKNYYNGGASMQERCRDQSIYSNVWTYTSYNSLYNISRIDLSNEVDGATTKEIAWDEVWLYSPY